MSGTLEVSNQNMDFFLCVIGMVLVIEGLPYFAFPEKVKLFFLTLHNIPDSTLRIMGFLSMLAGLLLVYLGRN